MRLASATRGGWMNLKLSVIAGIFGGFAFAIGLFVYFGLEPIGRAFAAAGWSGRRCCHADWAPPRAGSRGSNGSNSFPF